MIFQLSDETPGPEAAMSIIIHPQHFQRFAKRPSSSRSSTARLFRLDDQKVANIKRASMVLFTFALLTVVFAGIIALRTAIGLHAFHY